jgi:phospholipid transport system substrate-binding protein
MRKNFFAMITVFIFVLSMGWMVSTKAADASDPVRLLQNIADEMIAGLKSHKTTLKSNPAAVYSLANRVVVPHADLDEMSKRVLPAQTWASATSAQRAQFKKEFTVTLERTYGSALAEYTDQTIKFFPVRGGVSGNTIKVDSQIARTDGPSIGVSYNLIRVGSQWKLYDMVVEGISMLQSFRSQFADKLDHEDMAALIKELSQHNSSNDGN